MRLLDRYLLREFLVPLAYCLCGFTIFWVAFDLYGHLGTFQEKHLKGKEVLLYYIYKTPADLTFILPMTLLLALLYALTNHAKHHELTAIRASGISLWRLSVPYFSVALLAGLMVFAINEFWAPQKFEQAEALLSTRNVEDDWARKLSFQNETDHRDWTIAAYNLKTHEMLEPNVKWDLPNGGLRDIHASRGIYTNGVWNFFNVQEWNYKSRDNPDKLTYATKSFPEFTETPELILSEIKLNKLRGDKALRQAPIPIKDILNYRKLHPRLSPRKKGEIDTLLQGRLAAPFTCLVVVLIALPFGALSGRRNVFVGVASSIFICFAYVILQSIGLTLGTEGKLPALLAAWLPNLIFGISGMIQTSRVR